MRNTPDVTLGCLEVVDSATLEGAPELQALALIAAYDGSVRLIDDLMLEP
ncbi:hypothetical protein [Brevibacterium luteolum]|nr:hypothetical protein [Brevibacterium luteolum]MCT1874097.1 hypothetical protein [Brevibacterium luteolum]MCT1889930.1 hypothetical protein [Brevibacterium luteolum]MCT1892332.1 hypothetical protein [Brevibacterium luteolum]MCT1923591.1 hypothetical protein [Brevibacterium luteolum]